MREGYSSNDTTTYCIRTTLQTGYYIPRPFLHQLWKSGCKEKVLGIKLSLWFRQVYYLFVCVALICFVLYLTKIFLSKMCILHCLVPLNSVVLGVVIYLFKFFCVFLNLVLFRYPGVNHIYIFV